MYRSWEAEGKTRSTMEVRADRVQFLGGPGGAGGAARGDAGEQAPVPASRVPEAEPEPVDAAGADADVPF